MKAIRKISKAEKNRINDLARQNVAEWLKKNEAALTRESTIRSESSLVSEVSLILALIKVATARPTKHNPRNECEKVIPTPEKFILYAFFLEANNTPHKTTINEPKSSTDSKTERALPLG